MENTISKSKQQSLSSFPLDPPDNTVKRSLKQAMIAERYPKEPWLHVYTDGFATAAANNEGAKSVCQVPRMRAAGEYCSNHKAAI